ncbi:MAG: hypothetical protein V3V09_01490 [Arenicellales bacterium]
MSIEHFDLSPEMRMRSYIQRVATGPELGKSISSAEAKDGMMSVLSGEMDAVQSAVYLIGLRMKRETEEENIGSIQGLLANVQSADVAVDDLVDIADPFDGFARGVPASTFLPAVMSACGLPAVLQGAEYIGPKYGVTHRKILRAADINVDLNPAQAAAQIENNDIGWAYLDQQKSCPALHDVLSLRERMVKRSVLTTIETITRPLHARRTHMLGGFVHRAYPPVYTMLAKQAGYDTAMVVRGVEGGVLPSLSQVARYFRFDEKTNEDEKVRLDPKEMGIDQSERAVPLPDDLPKPERQPDALASPVDTEAVASLAAQMGQAALAGEQGAMYDSLVYGTAIALHHTGKAESLSAAADLARAAIDSGAAQARFNAAK